jgi:hypothetical protein
MVAADARRSRLVFVKPTVVCDGLLSSRMAETFIEMTFVTVGPTAHERAVEQLASMSTSDVKVVQYHTRERTWFERSRLLVPEWDCRIVLRVHEPEDEDLIPTTSHGAHPYRTLEYGGTRTLQVPAALLELSESLRAKYAGVRAARLRFETRAYEDEVLDSLVAQLEDLGRGQTRGSFQRERSVLFGRIECGVEFVDDLATHVRRSGLVNFDRVRVDYY